MDHVVSPRCIMFYFYILQSKLYDRLYVGKSIDVKKRLKEHNAGKNPSTKPYRPWEVIYYEAHTEREDMNRREKYLKTTQGKQAIKRMLRAHFENRGSTT